MDDDLSMEDGLEGEDRETTNTSTNDGPPAWAVQLLQGCFAPLKKAYGCQAEELMRNRITHITKLEFLPCFKRAFNSAITSTNIQGGF
jgi:hypothetical protein